MEEAWRFSLRYRRFSMAAVGAAAIGAAVGSFVGQDCRS